MPSSSGYLTFGDSDATAPVLPVAPTKGLPPDQAATATALGADDAAPPAPRNPQTSEAPAPSVAPANFDPSADSFDASAFGPGGVSPAVAPITDEDLANAAKASALKAAVTRNANGTMNSADPGKRAIVGAMDDASHDSGKQTLINTLKAEGIADPDVQEIPGEDGNYTYRDNPNDPNSRAIYNPGFWHDPLGGLASVVPSTLAAGAGALGGGFLGTLGAGWGAVPGAALGATAGHEALRQAIMGYDPAAVDTRTLAQRAIGAGTETGLNAVGEWAGPAILRMLSPSVRAATENATARAADATTAMARPPDPALVNLPSSGGPGYPGGFGQPTVDPATGLPSASAPVAGYGLTPSAGQIAGPGSTLKAVEDAAAKMSIWNRNEPYASGQSRIFDKRATNVWGGDEPPAGQKLTEGFLSGQRDKIGDQIGNIYDRTGVELPSAFTNNMESFIPQQILPSQAPLTRQWIAARRADWNNAAPGWQTSPLGNPVMPGDVAQEALKGLDTIIAQRVANTDTATTDALAAQAIKNRMDQRLVETGMQGTGLNPTPNPNIGPQLTQARANYKAVSTMMPVARSNNDSLAGAGDKILSAVESAYGGDTSGQGIALRDLANYSKTFLEHPSGGTSASTPIPGWVGGLAGLNALGSLGTLASAHPIGAGIAALAAPVAVGGANLVRAFLRSGAGARYARNVLPLPAPIQRLPGVITTQAAMPTQPTQ